MLKYITTEKTGAPNDDLRAIIAVNYYYETTTNVMYMQGEYEGNFLHTDPINPIVKADRSYLTRAEWEEQFGKTVKEQNASLHLELE